MPRMVITEQMRRDNPAMVADLERAYAEADAAAAAEQPATPVSTPDPTPAPAPEPAATTAPNTVTAEPAPATPPAAPETQPTAQPPVAAPTAEDWQRKLDQLHGSYGRKLQALENKIQDLEQRLQDQPAATPAPAPAPLPPVDREKPITDEMLVAFYGQRKVELTDGDTLRSSYWDDVQRKKTEDDNARRLAELEKRDLQRETQARLSAFWNAVDALEPRAKDVDDAADTNGFADWLDQPLKAGGSMTHRMLAHEAKRTGDAATLAGIYHDFLAAHPQAVKPAVSTPAPKAPPVAVQPGSATPTTISSTAAAQAPKVSQSEYLAFLKDAETPGKYTREEREQRESAYKQALRTGNLIP